MKRLGFIFPLLLTAAFAIVWLCSWTHNRTLEFTGSRHSYHVAATHGILSITIFSIEAEEDDRREFALPLWIPTVAGTPATVVIAGLLARDRKRRSARGFPLTPGAAEPSHPAIPANPPECIRVPRTSGPIHGARNRDG